MGKPAGRTAAVFVRTIVVSVLVAVTAITVLAGTVPIALATSAPNGTDVSVTGPTPGIEDEPSIAIDPADPSHVLVAAQRLNGACVYYQSIDGGASWGPAHYAPLTHGAYVCYDIVAKASPDGRFFYLSYLSIVDGTNDDVAVLRIRTDFSERQGPFVAISHR